MKESRLPRVSFKKSKFPQQWLKVAYFGRGFNFDVITNRTKPFMTERSRLGSSSMLLRPQLPCRDEHFFWDPPLCNRERIDSGKE